MGSSQSNSKHSTSTSAATVSDSGSTASTSNSTNNEKHLLNSKVINTPIFGVSDEDDLASSGHKIGQVPTPTGDEYDLMDQLASDLPSVIDDESKQQVEDYIRSCNNGQGPMVACFSTAEYLSLFLRKHADAADLYNNTCFRPLNDNSPNGVEVDGTKAYAPSCFNLAQMRMTGKGRTKFSRSEGYQLFDRACRGGHGGACFMQAKMLMSYPGSLGEGVPYDVPKAAELLKYVCEEKDDSVSCFTLATMLLRGDKVSSEADNVTPEEARGLKALQKRVNEPSREKRSNDERTSLKRDPKYAEQLLKCGCQRGHAPSCYNLAVMYTQGDEGVEKDEAKAKDYQEKTEELVKRFGGFGMGGM
jgi:TPR repeat protein